MNTNTRLSLITMMLFILVPQTGHCRKEVYLNFNAKNVMQCTAPAASTGRPCNANVQCDSPARASNGVCGPVAIPGSGLTGANAAANSDQDTITNLVQADYDATFGVGKFIIRLGNTCTAPGGAAGAACTRHSNCDRPAGAGNGVCGGAVPAGANQVDFSNRRDPLRRAFGRTRGNRVWIFESEFIRLGCGGYGPPVTAGLRNCLSETTTHEIGHICGLGHNWDAASCTAPAASAGNPCVNSRQCDNPAGSGNGRCVAATPDLMTTGSKVTIAARMAGTRSFNNSDANQVRLNHLLRALRIILRTAFPIPDSFLNFGTSKHALQAIEGQDIGETLLPDDVSVDVRVPANPTFPCQQGWLNDQGQFVLKIDKFPTQENFLTFSANEVVNPAIRCGAHILAVSSGDAQVTLSDEINPGTSVFPMVTAPYFGTVVFQWDTNGDGVISTDDPTTSFSAVEVSPTSGFTLAELTEDFPVLEVCDIDANGNVDTTDIGLIFNARGSSAAPGDPRDYDIDGQVTLTDARACTLLCNKPRCAP